MDLLNQAKELIMKEHFPNEKNWEYLMASQKVRIIDEVAQKYNELMSRENIKHEIVYELCEASFYRGMYCEQFKWDINQTLLQVAMEIKSKLPKSTKTEI